MINLSRFYVLLFSFFSFFVSSQNIIAEKGSYGIDKKTNIIVWHVSNLDSMVSKSKNQTNVKFGENLSISINVSELTYKKQYAISDGTQKYDLYITTLPLVSIEIDTTILNKDERHLGNFAYYYNSTYLESEMGIRQRGNLSLTFPKKSYDIEFWKDGVSKDSKDLKFIGLRSDDDWVLDGLYNEPLKLRSHISTQLWLDIHSPHYKSQESKAKSGFDAKFVELFRNNEYRGLYALSEQVDRKLLQLVKNEADNVHGELFKANSYEGGPAFEKAGEFNNLFPHYLGFRMEYPVIDYNSYWDNLSQFLDLIVNQSDEEFVNAIETKLDLTNAIDYYLFINYLRASDNMGKNYYLGKYNKNQPYFFIPWDLDSAFGNAQIGKRVTNTTDILSNGLFDRLLALNPNQFREKVKSRWKSLRDKELSDSNSIQMFSKYYKKFNEEKIYVRNQQIWPKTNSDEQDYEFLMTWLKNRMISLDTYFESL